MLTGPGPIHGGARVQTRRDDDMVSGRCHNGNKYIGYHTHASNLNYSGQLVQLYSESRRMASEESYCAAASAERHHDVLSAASLNWFECSSVIGVTSYSPS